MLTCAFTGRLKTSLSVFTGSQNSVFRLFMFFSFLSLFVLFFHCQVSFLLLISVSYTNLQGDKVNVSILSFSIMWWLALSVLLLLRFLLV